MKFAPRLSRPTAGNKYYIQIASGGYSTAIKGSPTDSQCNVLSNCVGYAVGRFHEIADRPQFDLIDPVNAENLFENAKRHNLRTGTTPELGALIVWQKGQTLKPDDGAGHVAVVEAIAEDGTITTSESGYGCTNPFWTAKYKPPYYGGQGYTLLGFIYQHGYVGPPAGIIRRGDFGEDVLWMQNKLYEAGYMRDNETDGDFGTITFGALLAFQFDHALEVDGVCGPKTKNALTKY